MKKFIMAIVCLMTMVVSANAQDDMYYRKNTNKEVKPINETLANNNGWIISYHEPDELTGSKGYNSMTYLNETGGVVLWSTEAKKFRVISNEELFDSEIRIFGWLRETKNVFCAIIGMYDINNKLLKKKNCWFEIGANYLQGHSTIGASGKNEGKDIVEYLRNGKGYIRIVAPLSGTNAKFDLKVPCMNN